MHPLQVVAVVAVGMLTFILAAIALMAFILTFLPDAIKYKGENSRLIRWPAAIKRFLASVSVFLSSLFFAISVLFDRRRAEDVMEEIQTGQLRLPFET